MNSADGTVSWDELLAETQSRLASTVGEMAVREARWICEEAAGCEPGDWAAVRTNPATVRGVARLDDMVQRRRAGEPLQYVLGHWPFRNLDLMVDRRVLIPRPETEQLVDVALEWQPRPRRVLDLGTGSGALALAFVTEVAGAEVWAVEADRDAAAVASANVAGVGFAARRVRLLEGDWFAPVPAELSGGFDLVVSNPPYVADTDEVDAVVLEWEPAAALYAADDGFADLAHIIAAAPSWLSDGGVLVCEMGQRHGQPGVAAALAAGFSDAEVVPDLTGRDRFLRARRGRS
jgi:release factor glutamine methyltransferase